MINFKELKRNGTSIQQRYKGNRKKGERNSWCINKIEMGKMIGINENNLIKIE